jgi:hypothetical protein
LRGEADTTRDANRKQDFKSLCDHRNAFLFPKSTRCGR